MNRRKFLVGCSIALGAPAIIAYRDVATAANILNYVESIRRKSPVVYVGTVTQVRVLERTPSSLQARAVVRVLAVARGQDPASGTASLRYSTYDDQTPANDGGLQYQIKNNATLLVFADSFDDGSPLSLWQGTPTEILTRIESLADNVDKMSDDDLAFEGISQEDRVTQLALYSSLLATLRGAP